MAYYVDSLTKKTCPTCSGQCGWGMFGACDKDDVHFRQLCYTCWGEGSMWDDWRKCGKCQGKGGSGAFGPCDPLEGQREHECGDCDGRGYHPNPNIQPQHRRQPKQEKPESLKNQTSNAWMEGSVLRLMFLRSSGKNLQCTEGQMAGRGGNGEWAQWQVKKSGSGHVRLYNAKSDKYVALRDGETTTGSGGKWTELLPVSVDDGVWVLQSVHVPAWHVGVLPSGDIKRCDQTGTGAHAQFVLQPVLPDINVNMNMGGGMGMSMGTGPQGLQMGMGGPGMGMQMGMGMGGPQMGMGGAGMTMGAGPNGMSFGFNAGDANASGNTDGGNVHGGGAGFNVNFGGMGMNMGMGF